MCSSTPAVFLTLTLFKILENFSFSLPWQFCAFLSGVVSLATCKQGIPASHCLHCCNIYKLAVSERRVAYLELATFPRVLYRNNFCLKQKKNPENSKKWPCSLDRCSPFPKVTFLCWGGAADYHILFHFTSYKESLKRLFSLLFLLLATGRKTAAFHNLTLVSFLKPDALQQRPPHCSYHLWKPWTVPEGLPATGGSSSVGLRVGKVQGPKVANV